MRISDWSSDVCSSDLHRCRLSAPRQVISAAYPDPPPGSGRAQENTTEAFGRGLSVSDRGLSVHEDIIHPDRIGVRLFIGGDVANRFRLEDDDVGERTFPPHTAIGHPDYLHGTPGAGGERTPHVDALFVGHEGTQ